MLRLGQEEVPVRGAPTASLLKRSQPTESLRNVRSVCWQCGGTGHLRRECPWKTAKKAVDEHNWRTDGAARGRDIASRQLATSTPASSRVTLLLNEKRRLEASNATLEKQVKELKAKMAELRAALERKTKATIAAPKEEDSDAQVQRHASYQKVQEEEAAS
jgi:hypothetical protein